MESEKMREEFEEWFGDTLKKQETDMPKYCISTLRFSKEVLWEGWKARQESLVIELPVIEYWHDPGYGSGIDQCADAIKAAGLKVKQG